MKIEINLNNQKDNIIESGDLLVVKTDHSQIRRVIKKTTIDCFINKRDTKYLIYDFQTGDVVNQFNEISFIYKKYDKFHGTINIVV